MKELRLKATEHNIETATEFINRALDDAGCSDNDRALMDIALDELFCNIARYAYGNKDGNVTVRYEFDEKKKAAIVTLVDSGIPFDPLQKEDPDVTLSAEDRKIGGLGIYMVKKIMDAVEYKYEDGHNIIRIIKNI
jgi:anti-sigma regulatory factor (Ser/Thr protein kinase)